MSLDSFEEYNIEKNNEVLDHCASKGYMESVEALFDKVIIRRAEKDNKSAGGIITNPKNDEPCNQGLVIATGDDCKKVRRGDHVIFSPFAGSNTIEMNGELLLVLMESEVCGKLTRKEHLVDATESVA